MRRYGLIAALLIAGPTAAQAPPAPQPKVAVAATVAPPAVVVDWIARHAAPVGAIDRPPATAEAAAIDRITGNARVIGFGESNHGNREPLNYRNRLVHYLVEHRGLTAVALESGLAESHRLYDYVLGGAGDPATLVRTGLTHSFGQLAANRALVDWLRDWNRDHPRRQVRLYGIDHSTIQSAPPGARPGCAVLDEIIDYLVRTVPDQSGSARAGLKDACPHFNETEFAAVPAAERRAVDATIVATQTLFASHRSAMIAATSADAHDWAARELHDAARLPALFAAWRIDGSDLPALKHVLDLRDGAMADHVLWVLQREGPHGRVLLFQANGHVTAAPMVGSIMRDFIEQPLLTGIALRRALGRDYRVIVTASSRGKAAGDPLSGSIDRAFAAAGCTPALLDLGASGRPHWWSAAQTASQGDTRLDDVTPAAAFDGIVYFDRLTPLPPPGP